MASVTSCEPGSKRGNGDLVGNRVFVRLFLAHTGSLLGSTLTMAALALLAEEMLGKGKGAAMFGVALAIRILVFVFLSPLAGNIAARFGRRAVMIGMDVFRALVVIGFFFASQLWHVYVLVFFLNVGSALFTPIYKSVIPGVVGQSEYPRALALGSMAYKISEVIGPMLAAGVILAVDFRGNFLLDILTFLGSALLLVSLQFPGAEVTGSGGQRQRAALLFGIRQMFLRPGLRRSLALSLCESVVGSLVIISTASYVIGELELNASMYPIAAGAAGLGALLVAVIFAKKERHDRLPVFLVKTSVASLALALVVAGSVPHFAGLFVGWIFAGVGIAVLGIRSNEELAAHSVEEERAHVYAAHFSLSHAGWGIFYPLSGFLSTRIGFNATAWVFLVILGLVSLTLVGKKDH
jgi:MFS family permease